MKILAENKRAFFDYDIQEKLEAGIVLTGAEVKSAKLKRVGLKGSYVVPFPNGEIVLINATISPYQVHNTPVDYDPRRPRKLLLKKKEISFLVGKGKQRGLTLIPLRMYTKHNLIKIEIGLGRGKKKFDKRAKIKKREIERKIRRTLKGKGDEGLR